MTTTGGCAETRGRPSLFFITGGCAAPYDAAGALSVRSNEPVSGLRFTR